PDGLSPHTTRRLGELNLPLDLTGPIPIQASDEDFRRATRIIALKETEHRPLMERLHPEWENRVEYWEIHDLDAAMPDVTLAEIESHVAGLVDRLEG
ncbi:MAG: hypothetical protein A3G75_12975, partial [Verrucomicrobia bacterium RIFCSPLOWO2_12_FULL_64_8]